MLLALIGSARGQTAYSYRYWFDADDATVYAGSATGEATVELDIGSIAKGALHALHIQALDARDKWGAVHTSYFFYTRGGTAGATARYWFDSEESRQTAPTVNGMLSLDIASLECGIHALHIQMYDASGSPSPVQTAYFYKGAKGNKARYWFDNETNMRTVTTLNGTIDLDIASLGYGIHAVHFQAFSEGGVASPVQTAYFYKKEGADISSLSCRLWIDDGERAAKTYALSDGDIVMEAEGLSYGMHDLHVTLLSAGGQVVAQTTIEFEVLDPDGITLVQAFAEDDACYDVAGRRIPKMQKGIYIKGGKKVLVK